MTSMTHSNSDDETNHNNTLTHARQPVRVMTSSASAHEINTYICDTDDAKMQALTRYPSSGCSSDSVSAS